MKERSTGVLGKLGLFVAVAAVIGATFAAVASANNLDAQTAQNAARTVAKRDCQNTSGCQGYRVFGLHKVSRHKAVGKVATQSVKNGTTYVCTRQVVIKLDHFTGEINYSVSKRRCHTTG
ncbi:MAG: hypothetical protein GEU88_05855 [Solirubrobacterales bacterium]|nr:hypothetical protein [Solirubrobacterales bacterium]